MTQKKQIILLVLLAVGTFTLLLLPFIAFASETLIEQTIGCTVFSSSPNFKLGQTFTLDGPATITEIQAEQYSTTYDDLVLEIWTASSTTGKPTGSIAIASTSFGAFGPVDDVCNNDWHSFELDTPLELEAGFYAFVFDDYDNAKGIKMYYKNTDGYADGTEVEDNNDSGATWDVQVTYDLKFKIIGTAGPSPSVSIVLPSEGATIYSTHNWSRIAWDFADEELSGFIGFASLAFSTSSDISSPIITGSQPLYAVSSTGGTVIFTPDFQGAGITAPTTTIYERVQLYQNTATTSIIVATATSSFIVSAQWGDYEFPFTGATGDEQNPFYIDCSGVGTGGIFSTSTVPNILCNLQKLVWASAGFLIMPQDWATNMLNNSYLTLRDKFPFSAVFVLTDTLKDVTETASSTDTGEAIILEYPANTPMSLVIISSSTLDGLASGVKDEFFAGVKYILWAICGFMILKLII